MVRRPYASCGKSQKNVDKNLLNEVFSVFCHSKIFATNSIGNLNHPCSLDDLTPPASSSSTASTKSTLNDVSGDDLVDDLGLAGLQHHFDDFDYEAESNRLINSF